MVEEIYKMKNEILKQAGIELHERGPERMDVDRLGQMIDMVKDLAEAEKSCWEAQYYRSISEAMNGKQGYQSGYQSGYQDQSRQGYNQATARQGYGSMGHMNIVDQLESEFKNMPPEAQGEAKAKIMAMLGKM